MLYGLFFGPISALGEHVDLTQLIQGGLCLDGARIKH